MRTENASGMGARGDGGLYLKEGRAGKDLSGLKGKGGMRKRFGGLSEFMAVQGTSRGVIRSEVKRKTGFLGEGVAPQKHENERENRPHHYNRDNKSKEEADAKTTGREGTGGTAPN